MILFDIALRERAITRQYEAVFRRYLSDAAFKAAADQRLSPKHRHALEVLASEPGAHIHARIITERLWEIRLRLRDALDALNEASTNVGYTAEAPSQECA